ncbi:hypothetical protein LshimejAT787_1101200 [Lyophyllum shimeji]|uniref:Uncharacterized protein n=1 Tax=Lyophyllum shimeji TaxID=47721 RepID=A0A9P3PSS3_LYOSH|nr:hypothetical protein LshimejAT787_1101200 [Lyophyllum shimeji]
MQRDLPVVPSSSRNVDYLLSFLSSVRTPLDGIIGFFRPRHTGEPVGVPTYVRLVLGPSLRTITLDARLWSSDEAWENIAAVLRSHAPALLAVVIEQWSSDREENHLMPSPIAAPGVLLEGSVTRFTFFTFPSTSVHGYILSGRPAKASKTPYQHLCAGSEPFLHGKACMR